MSYEMERGNGPTLVGTFTRRSTIANLNSLCGTRSRSAGLGEEVCAHVAYEIGPSCEDVVAKSSGFNGIADKIIITILLSRDLQSHFGKSPVDKEATTVVKLICRRIFDTARNVGNEETRENKLILEMKCK